MIKILYYLVVGLIVGMFTFGFGEIIDLADYGAIADGKVNDSLAFKKALEKAARAEKPLIKMKKNGIYRLLTPDSELYYLTLENISNLTMDGNDSEIRLESPAYGGFGFVRCDNLVIKNLKIDYQNVPYVQAVISSVDPEGRSFDCTIEKGFPDFNYFQSLNPSMKRFSLSIHHASGDLKEANPIWAEPERIGEDHFRLKCALNFPKTLEKGSIIAAVFRKKFLFKFESCNGVHLENLSIYSASAFALYFVFTERAVIDHCMIIPRPNSNRILSASADGIHVIASRVGPVIKNCILTRLWDDAIVVSSRGNMIRSIEGKRVEMEREDATAFSPGDVVELVDYFKNLKVTAKVIDVFLGNSQRPIIELEKAIENSERFSIAFNLSRVSRGTRIENNEIDGTRARGIKLHGREILVTNNRVKNTTGSSIHIGTHLNNQHSEINYYGGGITIVGNILERGLNYGGRWESKGAIHVENINFKNSEGPMADRFIEFITISNNHIWDSGKVGIYACRVNRLTVTGNEIVNANRLSTGDLFGIWTDRCGDLKMEGNHIFGGQGKGIQVQE